MFNPHLEIGEEINNARFCEIFGCSPQGGMRTQIKHLLRKYKYPPEQANSAIEVVIKQAELMSANIMPA